MKEALKNFKEEVSAGRPRMALSYAVELFEGLMAEKEAPVEAAPTPAPVQEAAVEEAPAPVKKIAAKKAVAPKKDGGSKAK